MGVVMETAQVGSTLGFDVTEAAEIVLQIAAAEPATETLQVSCDGRALEVVELPGRQHLVRAPEGLVDGHLHGDGRGRSPGRARSPRSTGSWRCGPAATARRTGSPASPPSSSDTGATPPRRYGRSPPGCTTICRTRPASAAPAPTRWTPCSPARASAATTPTWSPPCAGRWTSRPGSPPSTPPGCPRWTSTWWWRPRWTASGGSGTRPGWPRGQTLIRIATGRDAADTALATTLSGLLTMPELMITAVAAGDLPFDDHTALVSLA